jgi:NitT/TauT family transport system permease protein
MATDARPPSRARWLTIRKEIGPRQRAILWLASFLLPLALWSAISYLPFVWHPFVKVVDPGGVDYFQSGMLVERDTFVQERQQAAKDHRPLPSGTASNPIYLPPPHEVVKALYTAFTTPPRLSTELWLHESLWTSIKVIFWGFFLSSLIGVPLGILCGTVPFFSRLAEPFIEFFRYLPAPAFGALCVAVLGIYEAPKVAIIFIGTFFQQVLVVANTARKLDVCLLEAAQTLGASPKKLLTRVVVPGIVVDLYTDMRVLLGWAWTYLIVAELVGTTTGITYFINQQARYRNYPNVYAAIMIIGFIGLGSDMTLAMLGRRLFPWQPQTSSLRAMLVSLLPARRRPALPAREDTRVAA